MRRTSAFLASLVGVCTALACGVTVRAGAQHTDRHDERARSEDAAEIERRFRAAWRDADAELVSSRF
jgi:hypothetical protein